MGYHRLTSFALSAVARMPLIVHFLWLMLALGFLYVASRLQIWVRLLAGLLEHFWIAPGVVLSSSSSLIPVLLSQISSVASSAVLPMPLPRDLMQLGPKPDVSAVLKAAVDSATAD